MALRFGIMGAGRGSNFISSLKASGAEVVAICDSNEKKLARVLSENPALEGKTFTNYDEFLKTDMDGVILANYFCEHAPFAVKALRAGKHVLSETMSNITMAQGVELVRAVEETGKIYGLLENYPYTKPNMAMEALYKTGKLGKIVYGEGEYIHPMDAWEQNFMAPNPLHWRNWTPRTYYTTHGLAPIMQMTDCMPTRVTAMAAFAPEVAKNTALNTGDAAAILMIQTDNDAVFRVSGWSQFFPHGNNYRLCCTKGGCQINHATGQMRIGYAKAAKPDDVELLDADYDYDWPDPELGKYAEQAGHGGSDFYSMYHFVEKILGNPNADTIDVYEALDMFLPGMFAFRSILGGNKSVEIPNLRNKDEREKWRGDTACTDPAVAGDMLLPTFSKGTPEIDDSVYEYVRKKWEKECESKKPNNYRAAAFSQGSKK